MVHTVHAAIIKGISIPPEDYVILVASISTWIFNNTITGGKTTVVWNLYEPNLFQEDKREVTKMISELEYLYVNDAFVSFTILVCGFE